MSTVWLSTERARGGGGVARRVPGQVTERVTRRVTGLLGGCDRVWLGTEQASEWGVAKLVTEQGTEKCTALAIGRVTVLLSGCDSICDRAGQMGGSRNV